MPIWFDTRPPENPQVAADTFPKIMQVAGADDSWYRFAHSWKTFCWNMQSFYNWIRCDADIVHLGVGFEGAGKSALGLMVCKMIDPTFTVKDNVFFDADSFLKATRNFDRYSALMVDEAGEMLFSRNWNSPDTKKIVQRLMAMRSNNYFVWMNIPDAGYVDKYMRAARCKSMTRCVIKRNKQDQPVRGFAEMYTASQIRAITIGPLGQTEYPDPRMHFRFPNISNTPFAALWNEYKEKKDEFNRGKQEEINKKEQPERELTYAEKMKLKFGF